VSNTEEQSVTIARQDLSILSDALMSRYPTRSAEVRRVELLRGGLAAAAGLAEVLEAYTRLGIIHCERGTNARDLTRESAELFRAFVIWSEQLRTLAAEFRHLSEPSPISLALDGAD
jgi:hypothetical protein